MSGKADERSAAQRLEQIWNSRSPEDRADWIKSAGYTKETAAKYKYWQWSSLPSYVRNTLEEQEL